jgi:predicted dehydrogenase
MGARTGERTRAILPPNWFPLCHAEAIKSDEALEFVAICDENEEQRNWAAQHYGVPRTYGDYREMIASEQLDILAVATRTPGRCEIIKFAAEHGVRGMHVEKPLGNNVKEVRDTMAAVASNNVKLTYGGRRRHMETYRKAKQMLKDGLVGTLQEVRVSLGRTWLMWNHPHSVDLMLYYTDATKVQSVQGSCRIEAGTVKDLTIDDDPVLDWGALDLGNDVIGLISSASGFNTDLIGEQGILSVIADGSYLELQQMNAKGYLSAPVRKDVEWKLSGTQGAFHELAKAIWGEESETISAGDLLESQLALFSLAHSSLLGGARVNSSMLDDRFTVTGRSGDKYA